VQLQTVNAVLDCRHHDVGRKRQRGHHRPWGDSFSRFPGGAVPTLRPGDELRACAAGELAALGFRGASRQGGR